jgi:hypothetical protein
LGDVQEARRANSGLDAAVNLDTGLAAEETGLKALGGESLWVHVEVVDSGGELRVMPHGLDMRHLSEDGIEGIISIVADLIAERFLIVMPTTSRLKRRIIIRIYATELLCTHPKARDDLPDTPRKRALYIPNKMEMIRHERVMKHLDIRLILGYIPQEIGERTTEGRDINTSLSGVVIRDDKGAEERLAGCDRQRDMI